MHLSDEINTPSRLTIENIVLRVGTASAGVLLLHLAFTILSSAPLTKYPGDIFIALVVSAEGLFMLIVAGVSKLPSLSRWLITLACISALIFRTLLWTQTTPAPNLVITDCGLYADLAGELLLHGENPYTWDYGGAFDLYRVSRVFSTPTIKGAVQSPFPYPALLFLLTASLQALGLPGTFLISVAAHIAVLLLLFKASPKLFQPVILLPIVAGYDFIVLTLIGTLDITWSALLVGMVLWWHKPLRRAVLFGLAVAVKQSPWLITPFLLVRLWHEQDDGDDTNSHYRVMYFAVVSAITFLLVNAPFILWSPIAWLRGVFEPLHDKFVFLSQGGLASLTQLGIINLPKSYYFAVTFTILGLSLLCYQRHYTTLRDVFWIMPGIIMWFSYRSLISYWIFWLFPMLATLATRVPIKKQNASRSKWQVTVATALGALGILVLYGITQTPSAIAMEVNIQPPLLTVQGRVSDITVQVTNHSQRVLTPRFAVQRQYASFNPLPWHIEQGPLMLNPAQNATYRISSPQPDHAFLAHETAQIIVTDAGGDYALRGTTTISADNSFLWPDAILNPTYLYWDSDKGVPLSWELVAEPSSSAAAALVNKEGRSALKLILNAEEEARNHMAALQSQIIFPAKPFGIWVYVPRPTEGSPSVRYGLEINDGQHRLWVLFSAQASEKSTATTTTNHNDAVADSQYIINRPVPPCTWIYQEIDLTTAYAEAGWDLPELKWSAYRGLGVDLRLVNLRLFLASDASHSDLQAFFGPIVQDDYRRAPQTLMAETLDDPTAYYLRLAITYIRGRNYTRALAAYHRALQFSPNNQEILHHIDEIVPYLGEEERR